MSELLFTKLSFVNGIVNRANIQEDYLASSPNTLIKTKVFRAPRTGSVTALDSSSTHPSSDSFPGWLKSLHIQL